MDLFAFIVALGSLGVSLWVLRAHGEASDRRETALAIPEALKARVAELELVLDDYKPHRDFFTKALEDLAERSDEHQARFKELTLAVAEGIEHVDRSERRVRAAVRRAEKRLDEAGYVDPALEGEIDGLRRRDGEAGEGEGVQPVPADMETSPSFDFSDVPGEWG